jgi:hypothetical protein
MTTSRTFDRTGAHAPFALAWLVAAFCSLGQVGCIASTAETVESEDLTSVSAPPGVKAVSTALKSDGAAVTLHYTPAVSHKVTVLEGTRLAVEAGDVLVVSGTLAPIPAGSDGAGHLHLEVLSSNGHPIAVIRPSVIAADHTRASQWFWFETKGTYFVTARSEDATAKATSTVTMHRSFRPGVTASDAWKGQYDKAPSTTKAFEAPVFGPDGLMDTCTLVRAEMRLYCGATGPHGYGAVTMPILPDGSFAYDAGDPSNTYWPYWKIRGQLLPEGMAVFTRYEHNHTKADPSVVPVAPLYLW